jgi:hypothetical protein
MIECHLFKDKMMLNKITVTISFTFITRTGGALGGLCI